VLQRLLKIYLVRHFIQLHLAFRWEPIGEVLAVEFLVPRRMASEAKLDNILLVAGKAEIDIEFGEAQRELIYEDFFRAAIAARNVDVPAAACGIERLACFVFERAVHGGSEDRSQRTEDRELTFRPL
jgi:hypothetical protein